jgi:hypothetical protein
MMMKMIQNSTIASRWKSCRVAYRWMIETDHSHGSSKQDEPDEPRGRMVNDDDNDETGMPCQMTVHFLSWGETDDTTTLVFAMMLVTQYNHTRPKRPHACRLYCIHNSSPPAFFAQDGTCVFIYLHLVNPVGCSTLANAFFLTCKKLAWTKR